MPGQTAHGHGCGPHTVGLHWYNVIKLHGKYKKEGRDNGFRKVVSVINWIKRKIIFGKTKYTQTKWIDDNKMDKTIYK